MHLSDLGEDALIAYIAGKFSAPTGCCGIGDDCAAVDLAVPPGHVWLISTDSLVDGVHFSEATITPRNLGYKAVQVNLSDIAAMGGTPRYLLLSLGLPKSASYTYFTELIEGIREGCGEASVALIGGDTVSSPKALFLNLTVMGSAHAAYVKKRSGGRAGDLICTTGELGASLAGLMLMQAGDPLIDEPAFLPLKEAHQRPKAHRAEGEWLAALPGVTAMMDLSDGLATDLPRLAAASACGAEVDIDRLPIGGPLLQAAAIKGWDAHSMALSGGEEYCLLCAVDPGAYPQISAAFAAHFRRPLAAIGHFTAGGAVSFHREGTPYDGDFVPFSHFS